MGVATSCDGGRSGIDFPWGAAWDSRRANTAESGLNRTIAVGMYPGGASPIGALDLSGNVWQWCLNEYETPDRVQLTDDEPRVVRGGSFFYKLECGRTAYRDRDLLNWRNLGHGFRLVRFPAVRD
jgi:formylglycine-generating enzyme required for sulfatase activity